MFKTRLWYSVSGQTIKQMVVYNVITETLDMKKLSARVQGMLSDAHKQIRKESAGN